MMQQRFGWLRIASVWVLLGILQPALVKLWAGRNEWTSLGPEGGTVENLVIDPHDPRTIYASNSSQSFKSTDGGMHWEPTKFPAGQVILDPLDAETLYVATWGRGIFKSADRGSTWRAITSGLLREKGFVDSLVINAQSSTTLYTSISWNEVAGGQGFLFKSTDGGENWTAANAGIPGDHCCGFVLTIDPHYHNVLYAAEIDGIGGLDPSLYKSEDGGESWRRLQYFNSGGHLAIDPDNPNTIYATATCPSPEIINEDCPWTVFKSTDAGASWSPANSELPDGIGLLRMDPKNPRTLYAMTGWISYGRPGVFKTTDGGASWSMVNADLRAFTLALDSHDSGILYVGTAGGVLKSDDGGASWNSQNLGMTATYVVGLVIDPQRSGTVYAVEDEQQSGSSVFRTTDGGGSWTAINSGLPAPFGLTNLSIDPLDSSTLYAAVRSGYAAAIYKSRDGGVNWMAANSGLDAPLFALALDPSNPRTAYASTGISVTGLGIFKTTDGAATWHYVSPGPAGYPGGTPTPVTLVVDPQDPNTLYALALSAYYQIWKSTDGGKNFRPIIAGLPTFPSGGTASVFAFAVDPQNSGTLYAWVPRFDYPPLDGGLFKSTNGGEAWEALKPGLPDGVRLNSLALDPRNTDTLYAGTFDGVLKSTDRGAHWIPANSGLTTLRVNALAVDPRNPNTVYAATSGGGVFAITFEGPGSQ
jgi:photosystem II stability/assembly factor-like uncharacterized protein